MVFVYLSALYNLRYAVIYCSSEYNFCAWFGIGHIAVFFHKDCPLSCPTEGWPLAVRPRVHPPWRAAALKSRLPGTCLHWSEGLSNLLGLSVLPLTCVKVALRGQIICKTSTQRHPHSRHSEDLAAWEAARCLKLDTQDGAASSLLPPLPCSPAPCLPATWCCKQPPKPAM